MKDERGNTKYKETLSHCQLCGESTGRDKVAHMASSHPEYKFTNIRSDKYGKVRTIYCCGFCPTELMSIKEMIPHQNSHHELELKAGLVPKTQVEVPMQGPAILDNFFGGLGSALKELDVLRREKAAWENERAELQRQIVEWEKRAKRWSEQVVDLQQRLSSPEH